MGLNWRQLMCFYCMLHLHQVLGNHQEAQHRQYINYFHVLGNNYLLLLQKQNKKQLHEHDNVWTTMLGQHLRKTG